MRPLLLALALCAPAPALAHTGIGHAHGLAAGLLHPLGGLDHLVAMLSIGVWAGILGGRARLRLPLAFLGAMAAGAALGMAGVVLPLVEAGILASIIVLGALVAAWASLPAAAALSLGAVFGLLHGHAHGTEMAGDALGYAAGFLVATASLHGAGLLLTLRAGLGEPRHALRIAGAAASVVAGGALLLNWT
ncbi:HupE/UreJ family protein [Falsiroseomonas sp.]|uniref:HupE/UreJ family protein n=1 Tax=Falsiroseomonas sp. TaxID=2870721 RepID=UPI00356458FE